MKPEQLRLIGARLYGDGLIPRLYIKSLAKDLGKPESTIRGWWYGLTPVIPAEAEQKLEDIQSQRGRP